MALSRIVLKGTGSTNTFNVEFTLGWLNESDVTCQVAGEVDGSGNPIYRTITFVTPTQLVISGPAPGNNVDVIFTRTLPRDELLVNFNDEDVMNEENLQLMQKQMIMLVHEVLDGRFERFDADVDVGGFQFINLRTPDADELNSAATVEFVNERIASNAANASSSAASAAAAATSAGAANTSANAAAASAAAASTSMSQAGNSASAAAADALQAKNNKDAAAASATAAAGSATSASGSATAAAGSASAASASQSAAAASATAASGSASSASTSAGNAASSATAASGSASAAAGSASSASTSASTATTQATNASTSATLAQRWANEAENTPVLTGPNRFSAFHWAMKAQAFASGAASAISFTPYGNLAATNVQLAIQELDDEKAARASASVTGTWRWNKSTAAEAIIDLVSEPGGLTPILAARYGNPGGVIGRRINGTVASPTAVLNGEVVGNNHMQLWTGSAWQQVGGMRVIANIGAAFGGYTQLSAADPATGTIVFPLAVFHDAVGITGNLSVSGVSASGGANTVSGSLGMTEVSTGYYRIHVRAASGDAWQNRVAIPPTGDVLIHDGVSWRSVLHAGNVGTYFPALFSGTPLNDQTFNSSGTYTRPAVNGSWALVEMWHGGQGGGRDQNGWTRRGGAGGQKFTFVLPFALIPGSSPVTVGAGGAAAVSNQNNVAGSWGTASKWLGLCTFPGTGVGETGEVLNPFAQLNFTETARNNTQLPTNAYGATGEMIPAHKIEWGNDRWTGTNTFGTPSPGPIDAGGSGGSVTNTGTVITPVTPTGAGGAGGAASTTSGVAGSPGAQPGGGGGAGFNSAGGVGGAGRVRIRIF